MFYDQIFKAYGEWIGAYFRGDRMESTFRKVYFDMIANLPEKDQARWPK